MTDDTTQPVALTTEAPVTPGAEATGAQKTEPADLDSILAEFDQGAKTASVPEQTVTAPDPNAFVPRQEFEATVRSLTADRDKAAQTAAMSIIRGDTDKEVFSDSMINGWISDLPEANKIKQVWEDRERNPAAANKMLVALNKKFHAEGPPAKIRKLPDPDATEDRAAVTAAVRGASHKAPEERAPNYGSMNDAEFQKEKARLGF